MKDGTQGMRWPVSIAIIAIALGCIAAIADDQPDAKRQRAQFQQAYEAGIQGNTSRFDSLARGLDDYVLYPYLEYAGLKGRIRQADADAIADFLSRHDGEPLEWRLRDAWLRELARRKDWKTFLQYYRPNDSITLRCHHGVARLRTGDTVNLRDEALDLWLTGRSVHDACDPLFDWLYDRHLITPDQRFERTALALEAGNTRLAAWLARDLDGERAAWYRRWRGMLASPESTLAAATGWENTDTARRIVRHGLALLARSDDGNRAWRAWEKLDGTLGFPAAERGEIIRKLALDAATDYRPDALDRLAAVPDSHVDASVRAWRVRVPLQRRDWPTVLAAIEAMPAAERGEMRWRYWHARALEETGRMWRAFPIYGELAGEQDYYGYLAADRLGRPYHHETRDLPEDRDAQRALADRPAMARALELFHVGMHLSARREWHHALRNADTAQLRQAALLAERHGWHDRVISALADTGDWQAYHLRYPLAHEQELGRQARTHNLDPAWVYALVRAESGFITDAHSPAGARGLMQVMPGTGRDLSRELGLSWRGAVSLADPSLNLSLGTRYLANMLERFDGNVLLATAAYNAGPHNVDRWMVENPPDSPTIWAETIPFYETRGYIQRVLAYTIIYDWRLDGEARKLTARLPAETTSLAAGAPCWWPMVAACR